MAVALDALEQHLAGTGPKFQAKSAARAIFGFDTGKSGNPKGDASILFVSTSSAARMLRHGQLCRPPELRAAFGAEQFSSGNRPGTLTGFVHANPRGVLLFDEIEKAHEMTHEKTVQALLAVLDRGIVDDKCLAKPVRFRREAVVDAEQPVAKRSVRAG